MLALLLAARLAAADTGAVPPADTGAVRRPPATVRVVIDDSSTATAFTALGAELRLDAATPPRRVNGAWATPAELRLTRRADALTPTLAARLAAGRRLRAVTVELPGATDTLRVRLPDAQVAAARLIVPAPPADVESQRLGMEMAVAQLTADRDEAARQLAEADAVAAAEGRDRLKLVPANALARTRDQLRLLDTRLQVARRQLALFDERAGHAAVPTEELVLRTDHAQVLGAARPR